ncbi:hypothetical protein NW733_02725 [Mycoplasmopsis felis]|uniref:hypothetical protein n=1 Tax=Mycoplasmopsis felis TaxID=33923 RepID=UPI0021DF9A6B|nr:hypothetical protein [Mycoplasmopsis felis]MCU9931608.1 hypothetical protein [Mycoplasmopsis felis]
MYLKLQNENLLKIKMNYKDLINSFNYDINKFSESKLLKEIKSLDFSQKKYTFYT